jgi:cytochrome c-type biogenesis protein CcmE
MDGPTGGAVRVSVKPLVLGGLIVAAMVFLLVKTVGGGTQLYYLKVEEYIGSPVSGTVRLSGYVEDGSVERDAAGLAVRFLMRSEDGEHRVPVHFDSRQAGGRVPDTFKEGSQVVVTGAADDDGVFHATQLLAKCPSKYEAEDPSGTPMET